MALNTTPRTWVAGETVTATLMNNEVRDALTGIQAGWTTYTPTWSATGFTLGNGSATGKYRQVGKTVTFFALLTVGSTTAVGTGAFTFSLPATNANGTIAYAVNGQIYDASTSQRYLSIVELTALVGSLRYVSSGTTGMTSNVTGSAPLALATGDLLFASGTYEAS